MTVDTAVPPSQDEATEGTMSSEALPLIFDPSEDVTSEAAPAQMAAVVHPLLLPGGTGPPAVSPPVEVDPEQLDAAGADGEGPSNAPLLDWTSSETVAPLAPVVPLPTERQAEQGETSLTAPGHHRGPSKYCCQMFSGFYCWQSHRFIFTPITFLQLVFFDSTVKNCPVSMTWSKKRNEHSVLE